MGSIGGLSNGVERNAARGPLRVAIVGAGIFAINSHLPSFAQSSLVTLAAIYSRSSASCTKFLQAASSALPSSHPPIAIYNSENSPAKLPNETQIPCSGSLDDLLSSNSIDAVLLCLPISTQPSIIERALQNGKHVLSEKPIAPSLEIASPLVRRYMHEWQPKGLVWSVAEQWRHDSNVQRAGEALRSGELGRTSFFAVEYFGNNEQDNKYVQTSWRAKPDYQGGFLLDAGVHWSSLLSTCLPSPPTHISAHVRLVRPYLLPSDTCHATIRCADGSQGTFSISLATSSPARRRAEFWVQCEQGSVRLAPSTKRMAAEDGKGDERVWDLDIERLPKPSSGDTKPRITSTSDPADGCLRELEGLALAVRAASATRVGQTKREGLDPTRAASHPAAAIMDLAIIEGMLQSAQEGGQPIELASILPRFV